MLTCAVTIDEVQPNIPTLRGLALGSAVREISIPGEPPALICLLQIRFPSASPGRLGDGQLRQTYNVKPLVVSVRGESVFGEFAILHALQEDGWDGVWLDTFHQKFWSGMLPTTAAALPAPAFERYQSIRRENGGQAGGSFDVMAWRDDAYLFVEYKGAGDTIKPKQRNWIGAARRAGVANRELLFVEY